MSRACPLVEVLRPHLDGTKTVPEISAASGVNTASIYSLLRRRGWKVKVKSLYRPRADRGVIVCLPDHVRKWVERQCPLGLRLDEMITAIVTDAYHEEQK
jgi:hypothetical protein